MRQRINPLRDSPSIIFLLLLVVLGLISCQDGSPTPANNTSTPVAENTPSNTSIKTTEEAPVEITRIVIETQVIKVSPTAAASPPLPKHINICIYQEPESLYLYSQSQPSRSMEHVLAALQESMFTTRSYDYQAVGLGKIPSLEDGDAILSEVEVSEGDKVLDTSGNVVALKEGVKILSSSGEEVIFSGEPLKMNQLTVQFEMKPFIWSDGTPVTAADSVYSFELAADPDTPVPKTKIVRTLNYVATGDHHIEWTGIPGYMDRSYFTNIWPPLPRHAWGDKTAVEVLMSDEPNRSPLSYGPYRLIEWEEGKRLSLVRNENYYLADLGLPLIDTVNILFINEKERALPSILAGECDLITQELVNFGDVQSLIEASDKGVVETHITAGTIYEHIDFGINPVEDYEIERPDWFEDAKVRQAFAMCTDRQAILDELLFGQSELINAYAPNSHPLFPDDALLWPYDVQAANSLLDESGFLDFDEDGLRNDPRLGGEFQVTLLISLGNEMSLQIAEAFKNDLSDCGVEVLVESIDNDIYFADGPESPLFGRRFDLAVFPWLISIEPNCSLYHSSLTPGPENNWNRGYNNQTGFRNESFDQACWSAQNSLPGTEEYNQYHQEAMKIWTEQMPIIPLFLRPIMAANAVGISGFTIDPTQRTPLWNLANMDVDQERISEH